MIESTLMLYFLILLKRLTKSLMTSSVTHKLSHNGINGQLLSWIKDYLSDRSQSVVLDGISSRPHTVTSGVPQGTVLAPLLFLLYINDITTSVNSTIRLYADDVLIYRVINSENDCLILQNDINKLEHWADLWSMKFNPTKCVHLTITNKRTSFKHSYSIYDQQLQQVSSAKYLGVTIEVGSILRNGTERNDGLNHGTEHFHKLKLATYHC